MKRLGLIISCLMLLMACAEPVVDTFGNISGTVKDANTLAPLAGVTVKLSPVGYSQVTGNNGVFQFDNLDVQEYTISFSRMGYSPYEEKVSVKPGQSSSVQITMNTTSGSIPALYMINPTNLTKTSVRLHAMLSSIGGSQVTQHGFCYGTNHNPTTSDGVSSLGIASAVGEFSADISGLTAGTVYYCRAYAQNSSGLSYSDEITFTTQSQDGSEGGGGDTGDPFVVSSGLISYYTFDQENVNDATENELDGNALNSPNYITDTPNGKGKAVHLNWQKGQYINIPYNPFKGLPNYSIALWIKDFSIGLIISAISGDYARSDFPRLISTSSNSFRFYTGYDNYNETEAFSYTTTDLMSSGWHHIAVTCKQTTRCLYVDGKLVDTNEAYWSSSSDQGEARSIHIGGDKNGYYNTGITMKVDNVRFYNITLNKDQIKAIYEGEK
ncbi:MAG: carboxypeptidase-like regulatory domain-containing protein [Bacteroidaceae bacterium]|nr:carboxypeptidase-like regulatory domain-containing protein [Bacteroidaceae bacterium]